MGFISTFLVSVLLLSCSKTPNELSEDETTPPTLVSSTPADAATGVVPCTGNPCRAKIILVFSKSMNTALSQSLTTEIWTADGGNHYENITNTGTVFAWSTTSHTNDTLTIILSWVQFPENSQIRYTLAAAGLKDQFSNTIATAVQRSFSTAIRPMTFAVADTGQTSCYYYDGSQWTADAACSQVYGVGNTSYPQGQDTHYVNKPSARSFTGPTQHATYTSDYTTKDNTTGLIWKTCSEGLTGATCNTGTAAQLTWYNAISQCAALNTVNSGAGYAGRTDWRLPTGMELETLLYLETSSPAIDAVYFPATLTDNPYWSSSASASSAATAWLVYFYAAPSLPDNKSNAYYIRCVSGASVGSVTSFSNQPEDTVLDTRTNLLWEKCSNGLSGTNCATGISTPLSWANAIAYCENLTRASQSDWRLPTKNELMSIVDRTKDSPSINTTAFPATSPNSFWSSTTYAASIGLAWSVYFTYGGSGGDGKANNNYVRCVTGP